MVLNGIADVTKEEIRLRRTDNVRMALTAVLCKAQLDKDTDVLREGRR